jgi:hypothetical protein
LGAQTPALQLALAASQYWSLPQRITSSEESPLAAHFRKLLPEQKLSFGEHS